jgi:hypothetical protein
MAVLYVAKVAAHRYPLLHRVLWSQAWSFFPCLRSEQVWFTIDCGQNPDLVPQAEYALGQLRAAEVEFLCSPECDETFNPIGVDISTVNDILATYVPPGEA